MLLSRRDWCQPRAQPNRSTGCSGCGFGDCGGASNWVQFKLGNTFQHLTVRTRPNTPNPMIILHTGAQKESSPNEWLQKRGSGIWTVFWVRLMLFPKAWGPKAAPLFFFSNNHWLVKCLDRQLEFGVGAIFCTAIWLQGKKLCM